ncbi:Os02g0486900 [Oryza sativa Japonica Group]|uniref:Os02g0486900 protein n=1 Tax=Oryza sativa subsp. japonica TaxID=39947 RepID=A0A0P0VJ46_ORYSJ|nr:Os02g0486900 [Oryza sativa Japonica Group]
MVGRWGSDEAWWPWTVMRQWGRGFASDGDWRGIVSDLSMKTVRRRHGGEARGGGAVERRGATELAEARGGGAVEGRRCSQRRGQHGGGATALAKARGGGAVEGRRRRYAGRAR